MNDQYTKDLQFIKWNLENKEKETVALVVDILIKRYNKGDTLPDVSDPGADNLCDSCQ